MRRLSELIQRSCYPPIPVVAGIVLALPSLWVGIQTDDWSVRSGALGIALVEGVPANPWQPFGFDGDAANYRKLMDAGWMPWWTDLQCRAVHMRTLTLLTHMFDYRVWDDHPALMHLHSLVWYGALVFAAAILYRRILRQSPPVWLAGLAALMFAIDDRHAIPAAWLANRNSLLAGFFGVLTLIHYDRWRRDGRRSGAFLAPIFLLAGLLSKEEAVCACGYLAAYVIFLDRAAWKNRLAAIVPCAIMAGGWAVSYKVLGYGSFRGGCYIDPIGEASQFAIEVVNKAPIYLLGQLGMPPSDISNFWSPFGYAVHWWWAIAYLSVIGVLLAPLVMRVAAARFWAMGMLLSVIPPCAIFVNGRLLMFVGLGAAPLLSQWIIGFQVGADWVPSSMGWRRLGRVFSYVFIVLNLIIAPLLFPMNAYSMRVMGEAMDELYATLPRDAEFAAQTAIFVTTGSPIGDRTWIQSRRARGETVPAQCIALGAAGSATTVTRTDAKTLVVRPFGGYLRPRRWASDGDYSEPLISLRYLLRHLDELPRSREHPLKLGDVIELSAASVEVTAMTADNRPAEVTFRFRSVLEDPSYRWLYLTREGYFAFTPPAIGETVTVESLFE